MKRNPFEKFKRANAGVFYLMAIAVVVGFAANLFSQDDAVLRWPMILVALLLVAALSFRRWRGRGW